MRKIILFTLFLSSLYADSKIYMGVNYGYYDEEFTKTLDAQSSSQSMGLKVGYGDREAYAVEFNIERSDNESKIFSNNDGAKYSINMELIKSFDLGIYINPFFKAGIGAGTLTIDRELQDSLAFGSFNLGLGTYIPINDSLDIELGYSYKHLSYGRLNTLDTSTSYKSNINEFYTGFNVRF